MRRANLKPRDVTCVIVTRGNVDLEPITASLPDFGELVVWNNSERENKGIYGRFLAIADAKNDVVVTQDDDLIVHDWQQILDAYEPGYLTASYPEPWNIPWISCGSVFDKDLPEQAFKRWDTLYERDVLFRDYFCDGVFALLTDKVKVIYAGHTDMPYGLQIGRVSTEDGWYNDKRLTLMRCCEAVRDATS